tara:strand:- start:409 stop:588 length:180 start_codon:yes stop_codon:yes gene_type:complete
MQTTYTIHYTKQYSNEVHTKVVTCDNGNLKGLFLEVDKLKSKECLYNDNILDIAQGSLA